MAKLERTEKPINVILSDLENGELGLPEIQRGYVWKKTQVRDLIESLYKEYPCGLVLYWKPPEDVLVNLELRDFAFHPTKVPKDKKPSHLVLDGQQRLTSLHRVLEAEVEVYFNIEEEKFENYSRKLKNQPQWVAVSNVLQSGATKVWRDIKRTLSNGQMTDEQEDRYLDRLGRLERIKEYKVPVEILHTDDYEEITEAFIRINSKGTKLREAELALAQLAFHLPGSVSKKFDEALEDYEEKNFEFEARFLMRCFVAVATNQSRFKYLGKLWSRSAQDLEQVWRCTKRGLDYTVNFLRNNAGIESSDWIPSLNALVPLVVHFSKDRQGAEQDTNPLLFWFFSACMWGRYSSSPETKLDQDLGALEKQGNEGLLENLRKDARDLVVDMEDLIGSYQSSPFLPVLFAVIRKRRAKDWFRDIELSATNVGPADQLELHHIFPKAFLRKHGYTRKHFDDLANIAFLSQKGNRTVQSSEPHSYIKEFAIEKKRLEAQFVPVNPELWKVDRFEEFIQERRRLIAQAMNEYLSQLAETASAQAVRSIARG